MSATNTVADVACSICSKQIARKNAFHQWDAIFCGRKCREVRFKEETEKENEKERSRSKSPSAHLHFDCGGPPAF